MVTCNEVEIIGAEPITISARMLNKYVERTQPCRTPFLTRNHSDNVPATLTLASCFLYNLHCKSSTEVVERVLHCTEDTRSGTGV